MTDPVTHSEAAQLKAAVTLWKLPIVRAAAGWALAGMIGWAGGKLDSRIELERMAGEVKVLNGGVAALTSQVKDFGTKIDALSAPGPKNAGPITALQAEVINAQRGIVTATAIALAYESPSTKSKKRKAAGPLVEAFDNRVREGKDASDAAEHAIATIATP